MMVARMTVEANEADDTIIPFCFTALTSDPRSLLQGQIVDEI